MGIIIYLGDFGPGGIIGGIGFFKNVLDQGGTDDIGLCGWIIASGLFSLIIYCWAVHSALPEAKVDEYVRGRVPAAGRRVEGKRAVPGLGCPKPPAPG